MNETETNQENNLLLNKFESIESNCQTIKSNGNEFLFNNEIKKYINASVIKEKDIQNLIELLNNPPSCLNKFLESIMNDPNKFSQLFEIHKQNIKIKIYLIYNNKICQWCKENCLKNLNTDKIDININEINSKICKCGFENHATFKKALNSEDEKEINEIFKLHKDNSINEDDKKKLKKEKILNLIKGKENKRILQIISYILDLDLNFLRILNMMMRFF